jgi:hypothetical protein
MRPDGFVVVSPESQRSTGVCQAVEDLLVQALLAQAAVEAFNESVLLRLSGIDVMSLDTVFLRPFQDCLARELGAVNLHNSLTARQK